MHVDKMDIGKKIMQSHLYFLQNQFLLHKNHNMEMIHKYNNNNINTNFLITVNSNKSNRVFTVKLLLLLSSLFQLLLLLIFFSPSLHIKLKQNFYERNVGF